jgi:hypothetical protein
VPRLWWRDLLYDGGGGDRVGLHTVRPRHVLDCIGRKQSRYVCRVRGRVVLGVSWSDSMREVRGRDISGCVGGVGQRGVHGMREGQVLGCHRGVRGSRVPRLWWRDLLYDDGGGDLIGLPIVRSRHVLDRVGCKRLGRLCPVLAWVILDLTWSDRMREVRGRDVPVWIGGVGERCVRCVLGGHVLDRHRHVSVRQLRCW